MRALPGFLRAWFQVVPTLVSEFPRDYALSKNGVHRGEYQGTKYLVDLRGCLGLITGA
jgi:hypothetical protein